ncbi:MAG: ATP-binding cassette domain-containing protein [Verrucomicrobia bacterium]|nr:ATP-binding cassette domain-containing protein [Verrucomicrobiota bacterium]
MHAVVHQLNRRQQRAVIESGAQYESRLAETLHGHTLTRALGPDGRPALKAESALVHLLCALKKTANTQIGVGLFGTAVSNALSLVLLCVGAWLCLHHQLSAGQMMSCFTLSAYISGPAMRLITLNAEWREATIAAERLFQSWSWPPSRRSAPVQEVGPVRIAQDSTQQLTVHCRDLTFAYPGRLAVIKDLNVEFNAGQITALTGPSGGGKSTLLALLQNLYQPETGEICFGNCPMHMLHPESLSGLICAVPQEPVIYSGTLLENCLLLNPTAEPGKVLTLCLDLGLKPLITSHPAGLMQPIQERGKNLSGGQKQRLALIRMLVSEAPVWIMDEPTASLDAQSEQAFLQYLKLKAAEGGMVILATHSQAVLNSAHRIIHIG